MVLPVHRLASLPVGRSQVRGRRDPNAIYKKGVKMRKSISKILAISLIITFMPSQIQYAFAYENLSPVLLNDKGISIERSGVKDEVKGELDPGTIGRGEPWEDLFDGKLPEGIDITGIPFSALIKGGFPEDVALGVSSKTLRTIVAGLHLAITKTRANIEKVPPQHRVRVEETVKNLVKTLSYLYRGEFKKIHLFRAIRADKNNYLLGFNYQGKPGLAVDLIENLSLDEAAEYLFHEHVPKEHEIGHKIVYEEIQKPIFWTGEVNKLGVKLRNFIEGDRAGAVKISGNKKGIPTWRARYRRSKELFVRSAFGDQLVFGTSGIREFVKFLEDIKCFAMAKAILSYMEEIGEPRAMAYAGDFRPSTSRIVTTQIMAALEMEREIVYGGELPTPAVVYYGMYREEGAIPSSEITASHCPVLPLNIEQNGIKPNRMTGEVLKEDERRILKHVREFMEIEFMMREEQSKFGKKGMLKKKLSVEQKELLGKTLDIMKNVNKEVEKMYSDRYAKGFGRIFDENDKIPFVEHMAVGRDLIKKTFEEMGADIQPYERNRAWVEGLIVDTEDIKPKLAEIVGNIGKEWKGKGEEIRGIFTTDGDSDRPALFDEDGTFVYGDKLGYLTCEYIRNLKANHGKKVFVAVTATVSDAVIRRMESLGMEVAKVKIGSPYVVKAMEDRLARAAKAGEDVIACGFERNGGFLLGSDITLDNGSVLKALPTRDSLLPIITAFHTAKKEERTIGELVNNRFSGEYASYAWSSLIDSKTVDPLDAGNTELCRQYTATMGQAIMRNFSPRDLNIVEVQFHDDESITYLVNDGKEYAAEKGEEFSEYMNNIKRTLESYFTEDKELFGGIDRINYLDGVRMFFKNKEVIHMRPSGNSPQWRIYTEAPTLERAQQMTEYKLPVYPEIIKQYLEEKKKFEGVRILAKDNQAMKNTFAGVFDAEKDKWITWEMTFGPKSEHKEEEGIVFGENNESVSFYSTRIYDVTSDIDWLPAKGFENDKLEIKRTITWNRKNGTLICKEEWSDGRAVSVTLEGPDAWLEIGRGLDKNIPMGKFQDMPFPVMSDKARDYFKGQGVYWFDLFDVSVESEFTVEAPMWAHNFNFKAPDDGSAKKEDGRIIAVLNPGTSEELKNAQEFYVHHMVENLKRVLANIPEKKFLLAVDREIGGDYQRGLTNNLLKKISELQDKSDFENLLTVRGSGGEDLAAKINTLIKETEGLDMENVVIVARQANIDQNKFEDMEGRAIIAGIEDGGAFEKSYIPILETISIALGMAYGADYEAIKSVYDLITDESNALTIDEFRGIMKQRIIHIIPKAIAFETEELRAIYDQALRALISA